MYDTTGSNKTVRSYSYTDDQSLSLVEHTRTQRAVRYYISFEWVKPEQAFSMRRVLAVHSDLQAAHKSLDALNALMIVKGETVVVSRHADGTH